PTIMPLGSKGDRRRDDNGEPLERNGRRQDSVSRLLSNAIHHLNNATDHPSHDERHLSSVTSRLTSVTNSLTSATRQPSHAEQRQTNNGRRKSRSGDAPTSQAGHLRDRQGAPQGALSLSACWWRPSCSLERWLLFPIRSFLNCSVPAKLQPLRQPW